MIEIRTIFDILWKGFIIGVVVSAPLGPVGVLCIQRTLNKGRWYGFITGLGASLSDIAYALLTGYGLDSVTANAVTLSNPLIIFLFIGLFARFAFVSEGVLVFEAVTGYLAIALGALAWWFGITFFVNKVRTQFNLRGIWILNRIIGGIVIVVSVFGLVFTLMGESLY